MSDQSLPHIKPKNWYPIMLSDDGIMIIEEWWIHFFFCLLWV